MKKWDLEENDLFSEKTCHTQNTKLVKSDRPRLVPGSSLAPSSKCYDILFPFPTILLRSDLNVHSYTSLFETTPTTRIFATFKTLSLHSIRQLSTVLIPVRRLAAHLFIYESNTQMTIFYWLELKNKKNKRSLWTFVEVPQSDSNFLHLILHFHWLRRRRRRTTEDWWCLDDVTKHFRNFGDRSRLTNKQVPIPRSTPDWMTLLQLQH